MPPIPRSIEIPRPFWSLLWSFRAHGVEFAVVGGYALAVWGHSRFTEDLDLLLANTASNIETARKALESLGYCAVAKELGSPGTVIRIGRSPFVVDLLMAISGVDTAAVLQSAVTHQCSQDPTLMIPVIALDHLRQNKQASGRPKDLADLLELPEIQPE